MISYRTQSKIAQLFQCLAESERKTEVVRQVLAEQKAFEPYTAFKRIDRLRNGFITVTDLEKFLQENDIILTYKELFAIHKIFDVNGDGKISYTDFNKSILPKEDLGLRELASIRKSYPVEFDEYLPYEVEWALARVFEQEAANFRSIEQYKEILANSYDFNLVDGFNLIDEFRRGYISVTGFDKFMRLSDCALSDEEIEAFFRVVDKDEDGRISYSEYVDAILPNEPYNRSLIRSGDYRSRKLYSSQGAEKRSYYTSPKKVKAIDDDLDYLKYQKYRSASKEKLNQSLTQSKLQQSLYQTPTKTAQKSIYNEYEGSTAQKKSPMKGYEQDYLVQTLKEQIQIDKNIEDARKQLALRSDFNLLDGFRFFDIKGRGYITSSELERGLEELGIFPTKDEIYLFFRRNDKDSDGLLRYSDFCKFILPQASEYAKILNEKQPIYLDEEEELFDFETRRLFKKVLSLMINGEVAAESLRQKLNRRPLFSIHDAFNALDLNENGFITLDEFKDVLENYGIFATKNELVGLVKRYDKNMDGKVSYSEFMNEMTPKSPQKYY